jgi:hypothetical protein
VKITVSGAVASPPSVGDFRIVIVAFHVVAAR